jgi:acetoin:2,6-dichlorophenolindophenol oxidoreductase subunit alpha
LTFGSRLSRNDAVTGSTETARLEPPGTDAATALELYRRMLVIRGIEDRVQSLFLRGEVYGTTHLYSGQEAVAVGFASTLRHGDRVACTYRGHGHLLAMGTDPEGLLAELLGRETGVNGGRSGSMNIVDPEHGVLGCYGIVGGSIAAATGAALSLRGSGSIAVAYFGDGATNQAYFFECLNFAKVLGLPAVFVCENNGYGEYTPTEAVTPGGIVPRAAAMELRTTQIDGMDVRAVRTAAAEVVERVRSGEGPELVEARTYRFVGHSRSDPGKYRPEGELDRWKERDPLVVAATMLRDELGVDAAEVERVAAEVDAELDRIQASALAAPFPVSVSLPEFAGG